MNGRSTTKNLKRDTLRQGKGLERPSAAKSRREDASRDEHLLFERLISDLSARFARLLPDEVDREIGRVLHQLLDFFKVDRCGLLRVQQHQRFAQISHVAYAEGIKHVPTEFNLADLFPWTHEINVDRGEVVIIRSLSQLPPEASLDRRSYSEMGAQSSLCIPLQIASGIRHVILLQSVRKERDWPEEFVPRLRLLGEIFVSALERRKTDVALRESEGHVRTGASEWQKTFDSIEDMIVILDCDFRIVRVNSATVSFLGLPEEEIIGSHCHVLMHGTERPVSCCPVENALDTKVHQEADIYDEKRGLWLHVTVDPLVDERGDLTGVVHTVRNITQRKQSEEELKTAYVEIKQLKDRLEAENIYLRQEIETALGFDSIVGRSDALKYVLYRVGQFAPTDTTVLIMGETGTGKGVIARAIHSTSKRKDRPMVHVNCSALPANLIESELFGREKGAFTGAQERQMGRFELAHQGTIFLDEVGELPMELQSKLLRVLEDGAFERLGSPHTIKVDVRIIASTNRNLEEEVRNGRFREDLFYRLNVLPITVPPLRQRRDDVPLLVEFLVEKFNRKYGKHITSVPQDVMRSLQSYPWYGNVRELMNVVERAVITSWNSVLHIAEKVDAPSPSRQETTTRSLEDTEREHIVKVLQETDWKVEGPKGAAQILGLNASTLRTRMKKLGIHRPVPR